LPSFLTIRPDSDARTFGAGFLPSAHQGTPVNVAAGKEAAIKYLVDNDSRAAVHRRRLDLIQRMNRRLLDRVETDRRMEGMIQSFELAFRMQTETPGLVDISGETQASKDLYGIGQTETDKHGRACLLARRLSETGVRFVQETVGGWDHHANIRDSLPRSCAGSDRRQPDQGSQVVLPPR
jgi:hypothetical protein